MTALTIIAVWLGGPATVRRLGRKTDAPMTVATGICAIIPRVVALL